jgi:hypothetical protein
MKDNLGKVKLLARDLRDDKEFPRNRVMYPGSMCMTWKRNVSESRAKRAA